MNVRELLSAGTAAAVLGSIALAAAPALAGAPTMSTAPGSGPACGSGPDFCTYGPPPVLFSGATSIGLVAGDVINSISFGIDKNAASSRIRFSVTPSSVGVLGVPPDVTSESGAGEAAADIFDGGTIGTPIANALVADGDGTILSPAGPFFSLGLAEPGDDLAALATFDVANPLVLGMPLYFTLAPGSPTLTTLGVTPASILLAAAGSGGPPALFASPGVLGLSAADVVDALAYDPSTSSFIYSLAPGSPKLVSLPAGAGDLLKNPGILFLPGAALGLAPGDDIDAIDLAPDADQDLNNDLFDNCAGVANNDQADMNADGQGDACDDSDFDGAVDGVDNCPLAPNPSQADADGDGVGETCDPCTNVAGARNLLSKGKIKLVKINTEVTPGNDKLKIVGAFVNPTPFASLDPLNNGARMVITNAADGTEADVAVPYGVAGPGLAGWSLNPSGKVWKFKDDSGAPVNGIIGMKIINQDTPAHPSRVKVVITGKNGTYPVVAADAPLAVTVVLGAQAAADAGECGEMVGATCAFNNPQNAVLCKVP